MFADFKIMGRLTKTPDYRAYAQDKFLCHISVAVNKKNEDASFYNITAFGKTADFLHQHFDKGQMVYVEGRMKQKTYEKDGKKQSKIELTAEKVDFCGDGKTKDHTQTKFGYQAWADKRNVQEPEWTVNNQPNQPEWATASNEMPMDDTLPF